MKHEQPAAFSAEPLERLIPWAEVRQLIPLSRVRVWQLRQAGRFPAPVQVSDSRIAWRESDLRAWLESRASA